MTATVLCPNCEVSMGEPVDTTSSNRNSARARIGQHTGDIYRCPECGTMWLDNLLDLTARLVPWTG